MPMAAPAIRNPASNHNGRSKRSTSWRSRPWRAPATWTGVAAVLGASCRAGRLLSPPRVPPRVDRVAICGAGELLYRGTFLIRGPQGSLHATAFRLHSLCRPADGQAIDAQRRLSDAHRHALAVLAAGADTRIERHVVTDHRHPRQRIGAVADQRGALDRIGELAVLDHPRFGSREHELAVGDVDLSAAEV